MSLGLSDLKVEEKSLTFWLSGLVFSNIDSGKTIISVALSYMSEAKYYIIPSPIFPSISNAELLLLLKAQLAAMPT